jgi:hypothetical protein
VLGIYDSAVADLKQVCNFRTAFSQLFSHVKIQRNIFTLHILIPLPKVSITSAERRPYGRTSKKMAAAQSM